MVGNSNKFLPVSNLFASHDVIYEFLKHENNTSQEDYKKIITLCKFNVHNESFNICVSPTFFNFKGRKNYAIIYNSLTHNDY